MRMISISLFAAFLSIAHIAAIDSPAEVLSTLSKLRDDVLRYQASVMESVESLKEASGNGDRFRVKKYLELADGNIFGIYTSDVIVRGALRKVKPSPCVDNLATFLDQIIELSGYAVSNCISDTAVGGSDASIDFRSGMTEIESEAVSVGEIIIQALTGRNIFTQGNEITERAEFLLTEKRKILDASMSDLNSITVDIDYMHAITYKNLKTCFSKLTINVEDAMELIEAQIPICQMFVGRGARSTFPSLPNPSDFFPQLHR